MLREAVLVLGLLTLAVSQSEAGTVTQIYVTKFYHIQILSLNDRALNKTTKGRQLFRWLNQQNPDAIFLQETYSSSQLKSSGKRNGAET